MGKASGLHDGEKSWSEPLALCQYSYHSCTHDAGAERFLVPRDSLQAVGEGTELMGWRMNRAKALVIELSSIACAKSNRWHKQSLAVTRHPLHCYKIQTVSRCFDHTCPKMKTDFLVIPRCNCMAQRLQLYSHHSSLFATEKNSWFMPQP